MENRLQLLPEVRGSPSAGRTGGQAGLLSLTPVDQVIEGPKLDASPSSTFPEPQKAVPSTAASGQCAVLEVEGETVPRLSPAGGKATASKAVYLQHHFPTVKKEAFSGPGSSMAPEKKGLFYPSEQRVLGLGSQATEPPVTWKATPSALPAFCTGLHVGILLPLPRGSLDRTASPSGL